MKIAWCYIEYEGKQRHIKDLRGYSNGEMSVIKFSHIKNKQAHWECKCTCGKIFTRTTAKILYLKVKHCGYHLKRGIKLCDIPEYHVYQVMRMRCNNKKDRAYKYYGARGIKVCKRWSKSFDNFINDMGFRPNKNLTLERINVNKGYSPKNCKWATRKEQSLNKRNTQKAVYNGKLLPLSEIAKITNINIATLVTRLKDNPDKLYFKGHIGRDRKGE